MSKHRRIKIQLPNKRKVWVKNPKKSTNMNNWKEEFKEIGITVKYGKYDIEEIPLSEHLGEEKTVELLDFIQKTLDQRDKQIIDLINKEKEKTQMETGAFKYDFAYEDIIKGIKEL